MLKLISFQNNPKPPSETQILLDSAPYFDVWLPEIWGQKSCKSFMSDGGFWLFLKEMSFTPLVFQFAQSFHKGDSI